MTNRLQASLAIRSIAVLAFAALVLAAPAAASPGDVLYDQYNHPGTIGLGSQNFETALDPYDDEAADDFNVPAGPGWNVTGVDVRGTYFNGPGPATSFNVSVYANSVDLPGTLLQSRPNQSFSGGPDFVITLAPSIGLFPARSAGTAAFAPGARCTAVSSGRRRGPGRSGEEDSRSAWRSVADRTTSLHLGSNW
jgi:hypothetical protein